MTKQNEEERDWPASLEWAREAAGRAWAFPFTEDKEMDPMLARAFAVVLTQEFASLIQRESKMQNESIIRELKLLREEVLTVELPEPRQVFSNDEVNAFDVAIGQAVKVIDEHIKEYEEE